MYSQVTYLLIIAFVVILSIQSTQAMHMFKGLFGGGGSGGISAMDILVAGLIAMLLQDD